MSIENIVIVLLVLLLIATARCAGRLSEISQAVQDLAHRGKRLYPITDEEEESNAWAAEAAAEARANRRR